jgi:hypothetical protein
VYVQKSPALKKQIDIFEFIGYCWLILEQRLLCQAGMEYAQLDSATHIPVESVLSPAVLPASVVLFLEQLAPRVSHEGTKLVFAPYEYRQQNGGQHDGMTRNYVMTAGNISVRAARVLNSVTGQAVDAAVQANTVRCNIWRLMQVVETHNGQDITAQQINDALGYPVVTHGYRKRVDRINAITQGRASCAGSHFFNLYHLTGTISSFMKDKHFSGFYAMTWRSRLVNQSSVQTYDRDNQVYYFSIHFRRVEVICNPFIFLHANRDQINATLDAIGFPRYVRLDVQDGLSSYEKCLTIKTSLDSRDFSSMISSWNQRFGPKMF